MTRHVVVGTAGHVDHGKTALVRCLTGTETDRFEEEKRRGITIDIGFAHFQLPDGTKASVVDVPGHEDFVRNMVAGATGVDVALLVIAADEGVMPQTVEHLAILEFLGVGHGAIAITKADLVDPDWLELVIDDVGQRVTDTRIQWERPVAVSSKLGTGLSELVESIARAADRSTPRDVNDLFRLPVDRAFSVPGAGTVVTGTTWSGSVAVGSDVRVLPANVSARVRSIEVHGEASDLGLPGRRTAVALVGVTRDLAPRGSVVVQDSRWSPSLRVDVDVRLLQGARPLTQRSRVRFHLGTTEVMARVTPATDTVTPEHPGVVRLRLEQPVVCRWGDRGVLRSYSPVTTIGGCVVVDPDPPARPRRPATDRGLASNDPDERIGSFARLAGEQGLAAEAVAIRVGVSSPGDAPNPADLIVAKGRLFLPSVLNEVRLRAVASLTSFHANHPLKSGMPIQVFRRSMKNRALEDFVRTALEGDGTISVVEGLVRLSTHRVTLGANVEDLSRAIVDKLEKSSVTGVQLAEIEEGLNQATAADLLTLMVEEGRVVRIADRYYDRTSLDGAVKLVIDHLESSQGEATPASLRDVLGLSRKYLIPLLEWMDVRGITVRQGGVRRLGPNAHRSQ